MDFDWRRALTYLREDLDYRRKLAIVSVLGMMPFINVVLLGYGVEIYRNAVEGKKDEDLQPEWSNAGDFTLKGILSACIAIVYGTVATVLCVFVGLIFGVKTFGEVVTGSEVHVSIIAKVLIPLVIYAISLLFWSAYSLYAETVEMSRAFRMVEVVLRVQALGKGMLISVAIWCASIGLVSWLTGLIPWSFPGYALLLLFIAYASLAMVHIMSQLSLKYVKPVLGDVVNVGYMEYSLKQRAEESKFEDEYGHQKQGGRKASHYADHHPDEALTWSTDSDSPEL